MSTASAPKDLISNLWRLCLTIAERNRPDLPHCQMTPILRFVPGYDRLGMAANQLATVNPVARVCEHAQASIPALGALSMACPSNTGPRRFTRGFGRAAKMRSSLFACHGWAVSKYSIHHFGGQPESYKVVNCRPEEQSGRIVTGCVVETPKEASCQLKLWKSKT